MAEARFRQSQTPQGTWFYEGDPKLNNLHQDSMTCAGLLALAVGRGLSQMATSSPPQDLAKDPQVEKALLYLGQRIGRNDMRESAAKLLTAEELAKARTELSAIQKKIKEASKEQKDALNKRKSELNKVIAAEVAANAQLGHIVHASTYGDYYFLWSLERVAVLYGLRTIGGKDWYAWGSDVIVRHQRPDGSWADDFGGPVDTCFALLFLKRANVAVDLTKILQSLGGGDDPGGIPGQEQPTTDFSSFSGIKPIPVLLAGMAKSRFAYAPAPNVPGRPTWPYQRK